MTALANGGIPVDVLAIDVGGSGIKAARYDRNGRVLQAGRVPLRPLPPASELVGEIVGLAGRLRGPGTVAVGVVAPGVIADGVLRYAVNLGVRDLPLRELVQDELRLPTELGHDLAAAALAESAASGEDLLFVGLGTGIAAGLVAGGRLWRGANGMAGELGHIRVVAGGERCGCGQSGCLEVYASAAGIARRYAERTGRRGLDCAAIVGRLATDPGAAAVWHEAVEALADALATAVQLLDPATVVLGGGLALAGPALLNPVLTSVRARLRWRPAPEIRPALLGVDAGRAGAALLAWRLLDSPAPASTVGNLAEKGAVR